MLTNNRVIHNDNGTLRDRSLELNNLFADSATIDIVAAQDKLYLGSDLPFNHRYFLMDSLNDATATVTVDIWDGTQWVAAVDVKDGTQGTSGVPLSQNGILSWATSRTTSWGFEDSTEDMSGSGLETLKIYNMYWVRLTFSANLNSATSVKYVGHKFADDLQLAGYYPEMGRSTTMSAFESGKTSWDEQHIMAAEEIIRDLRKKKIIVGAGQILDWEIFSDAAIHKCAEIIYFPFGEKYEAKREGARDRYDEAMDKVVFPIDEDEDGRLSDDEKRLSAGLVRG